MACCVLSNCRNLTQIPKLEDSLSVFPCMRSHKRKEGIQREKFKLNLTPMPKRDTTVGGNPLPLFSITF